jgi:hypothetical protein
VIGPGSVEFDDWRVADGLQDIVVDHFALPLRKDWSGNLNPALPADKASRSVQCISFPHAFDAGILEKWVRKRVIDSRHILAKNKWA